MNKAFLIGRLAQDIELRYTGSGHAVANFTLAVERPFTNQQGEREADFIRVTVWRKQAENCSQYLQKGQQVAVEGRIQVGSYKDKEGNSRQSVEIVADNVQFLSKPQGKSSDVPF